MRQDCSPTRRGFLATVGATFLSGCSGLEQFSDSSSESISSYRLPDVNDEPSEPLIVETLPIDIQQEMVDVSAKRVTDLLGTLPMPFGPSDIPNGYVRKQLVDAADRATESLSDARTAKSRLSALQSLCEARADARYAAAGWAFAESRTTKSQLQSERRRAMSEARSIERDYEYFGTDVVDAVLVHARVERNLEMILDDDRIRPSQRDPDSLLTVAEWGENAESAKALISDSQSLYNQFRSSLPAETSTVTDTLTTAATSLSADLQQRRENLPPEPTERELEFNWRLRYRLRDTAEASAEHITEQNRPASAVLTATAGLTDFLAYDRVRDRLENGAQLRPTDAPDVRAARSETVEAIRAALEQSSRPGIARTVLSDIAATVILADRELSRYRGDVQVTQLTDPVRRYTTATARARSVPTACQHVLSALED